MPSLPDKVARIALPSIRTAVTVAPPTGSFAEFVTSPTIAPKAGLLADIGSAAAAGSASPAVIAKANKAVRQPEILIIVSPTRRRSGEASKPDCCCSHASAVRTGRNPELPIKGFDDRFKRTMRTESTQGAGANPRTGNINLL
jgi:hypothetical protein